MGLTVTLNGARKTFDGLTAPASVSDVVAALGLKQDRVAVERNGKIAARTAWNESQIDEGDKLEIVHFVGGGAFGEDLADLRGCCADIHLALSGSPQGIS